MIDRAFAAGVGVAAVIFAVAILARGISAGWVRASSPAPVELKQHQSTPKADRLQIIDISWPEPAPLPRKVPPLQVTKRDEHPDFPVMVEIIEENTIPLPRRRPADLNSEPEHKSLNVKSELCARHGMKREYYTKRRHKYWRCV